MTEPATVQPAPATVQPAPPPPSPPPSTPRRTLWPRPDGPAPGRVLPAALAGGAAAAWLLPVGHPGVGWLLTGLALAGLTRLAVPRGPDGPERPRAARIGWAVAALALLGVGTLRDAGWLLGLCVPAAALAGSVAVAGGRSILGLVSGALAVPAQAVGGWRWAVRGVPRVGRDGLRTVAAVLVTGLLLLVFTPLLAGGDDRFAALLDDLLSGLRAPELSARLLLVPVFAAGLVGAAYLRAGAPRADDAGPRPGRLRRVEWALPVAALVALFGVFVALQLGRLFGGAEHVRATEGLSYAEYARSGFWQLVAVTALTLAVLVAAARCAPTATRADRAWLRALLGALAGLTLVIVGSALSRMWVYQEAYGFTSERLLVFTVELGLGAVYLLLLAAGARLRWSWLPRVVAGLALAVLLALALLDPDRFIAERNIDRFQRTGALDLRYLSQLSRDAVPALDRLPEPLRSCALAGVLADDRDPGEWRAWDLPYLATRALSVPAPPGCPGQLRPG
jgi:hypothetical protein